MLRVYVLDPIPVLREGYAAVLSRRAGFDIVGLSGDLEETERGVGAADPDVVVLDARLSGIAWRHAHARIRRASPRARVILVVGALDAELAATARAEGVRGLLLRTSSPMHIRRAVRAVAGGELFLEAPRPASPPLRGRSPFRLTAQQMRVLELIARGLSNKDIGIELHISEHTVKTHVTQILRKLRARDRAHAAVIALREGIV